MFTLVILGACLVLVAPQNSPPEGKNHAHLSVSQAYSGCGGNEEEGDERCATTSNEQDNASVEAALNRLHLCLRYTGYIVQLLKERTDSMGSKLNTETESVVMDAAER